MKKMIYSIITNDEIGINLKDDVKINIFRILDNVKSKVTCFMSEPIKIKDNHIESYSINFQSQNYEIIGYYTLSNEFKSLIFTHIPDRSNPKLMEDYRITRYSTGVTEYHSRYFSTDKEIVEYYYDGNEITEEEAYRIINGKSK